VRISCLDGWREGFEVFRAYGGVETRVDVLKIGRVDGPL
jgi:hypothetical protein